MCWLTVPARIAGVCVTDHGTQHKLTAVMTVDAIARQAAEPLRPCGVVYLLPIWDELDEAIDTRHGWKIVAHLCRFFRCQARRGLHGCQH